MDVFTLETNGSWTYSQRSSSESRVLTLWAVMVTNCTVIINYFWSNQKHYY
jgi:hypothetical protein